MDTFLSFSPIRCPRDDSLSFEDSNQKRGKWEAEEDTRLTKYVGKYGERQWKKVSQHIKGRSAIQCLHRWSKILKPGLVKGPWTLEEDQKLIDWIQENGARKWSQVAQLIKGRSGKQCRERWFNNLNPEVRKGDWEKDEDQLIFDLYRKHGSSWSKIAREFPLRTENAIKNRFYSTLRKLAADKRRAKKRELFPRVFPQSPNHLYDLLKHRAIPLDEINDLEESELQDYINNRGRKKHQILNARGEKYLILEEEDSNLANLNMQIFKGSQQSGSSNYNNSNSTQSTMMNYSLHHNNNNNSTHNGYSTGYHSFEEMTKFETAFRQIE